MHLLSFFSLIYFHSFSHLIAPELFRPRGVNSKASDVYAFAIVCWEIVARSAPWKGNIQTLIMNWVSQGIETKKEKGMERKRRIERKK